MGIAAGLVAFNAVLGRLMARGLSEGEAKETLHHASPNGLTRGGGRGRCRSTASLLTWRGGESREMMDDCSSAPFGAQRISKREVRRLCADFERLRIPFPIECGY